MQICIDECMVQFSVITKEWSFDSISLKDLLIGIVVIWFWFEHKISFNLAEEWIEDLWNKITMNLWLWACLKSFVLHVLRVLHVFFIFVFTDLWFVRFLEAFELDSNELWDLGIWFGWFLFECSSYLKVCGGSSSGFWRLRSVELYQFVVSWSFWRLLSMIPVTFEI